MRDKWLRIVLITIGILLVLFIVLGAGIFVARLHTHGDQNPVELLRRLFYLRSGHGAIGAIQSIDQQTIVLQLRDGSSQTILLNKETRVERNRAKITAANLRVGDRVTVIGSPNNQGAIVARWIHVFNPPSPTSVAPTSIPTPTQ